MRHLITALMLCLFAAPLAADMGPKPRKTGPGMVPPTDMEGISVEMTSEEVNLVLGKSEKGADYLDVTVTFNMTNLGDETSFEVGFPVGTHDVMEDFSCTTEGVERKVKLIDKNPMPEDEKGDEMNRMMWMHDYWYVWDETYPADAKVNHVVKYRMGIWHHSEYRSTGYILNTGAAWKNVIKEAKVTLECEGNLSLGNVESVTPDGYKREGDKIVWVFKDLEPTRDDNIRIRYNNRETFEQRAERLEKESERFWSSRKKLADLRETAPLRFGREDYTGEEYNLWSIALANLVSEAEEKDGKLVLPAEEPEYIHWGNTDLPEALKKQMEEEFGNVERPYAKKGEAYKLLDSFEDVLRVYETAPDAGSYLKMLKDWIVVMQAWEDGKLYAGNSKLSNDKEGRAERWSKELEEARALLEKYHPSQPVE